MASNPVSITIPAEAQGQITAVSNAAYKQIVSVIAGDVTGTFTGTGEGVSMQLADGSLSLPLEPISSERTVILYFLYSTDNSDDLNVSYVSEPVVDTSDESTTVTITSEDASDGDNNDSVVTIKYSSSNN